MFSYFIISLTVFSVKLNKKLVSFNNIFNNSLVVNKNIVNPNVTTQCEIKNSPIVTFVSNKAITVIK